MCDDWDDGDVVVQPPAPLKQNWSKNANDSNDVWDSLEASTVNYDHGPDRGYRGDRIESRTFSRGGRGFGSRGSSRGRGGGQGRTNNFGSDNTPEVLHVPTRYVGRIIGQYGVFSS